MNFTKYRNGEDTLDPIDMKHLKKGALYFGVGRGVRVARWNGEMFEYFRYKYGGYIPDTMHHEDDPKRTETPLGEGLAGFLPLQWVDIEGLIELVRPEIRENAIWKRLWGEPK